MIDEDWDKNAEFFKELGAPPGGYDIADAGKTDDEYHDKRGDGEVKLFKYVNVICIITEKKVSNISH